MKKLPKEEPQDLSFERSKLSNAAFIKWIRSRFSNKDRKNLKYLYFPQQLIKETSIQKIFVEFDSDQSGGLSRTEVFDMFNNFGINITMDDLDELYDSVEVNLEELDCEKFKKCALSEQSNRVFRQIVSRLGEGYFPHNFVNMIIYIVFLSKREEIRKTLCKPSQKIETKVNRLEKLLKLNDLALNNEKLMNHTSAFKHSIKSEFRDVWQSVNQKHHSKFPMTCKLQQQFFQYCRQQHLSTGLIHLSSRKL